MQCVEGAECTAVNVNLLFQMLSLVFDMHHHHSVLKQHWSLHAKPPKYIFKEFLLIKGKPVIYTISNKFKVHSSETSRAT